MNLLEDRKSKFGNELGTAFHHILNQWCELWITYKQYEALFGTNEERINLLNKHGRLFFFNVEKHFWRAAIMGACRLTDPVKTGRNKNLTIRMLPDLVTDTNVSKNVSLKVEEAIDATVFHRERRNKLISHNDLNTVLGKAMFAEKATRLKMREGILSIHRPLNEISISLAGAEQYPGVIDDFNNENALLTGLYKAETYHEDFQKAYYEQFDSQTGQTLERSLKPMYPEWLTTKSWGDR